MVTETWKQIPGCESYEVSDLGNVRSVERRLKRGRYYQTWQGKNLTPVVDNVGYYCVGLGRNNVRRVHQLVMLAFVGEPPPEHEVAHNNGDPLDNRLANLRYDSHLANVLDMVKHGRSHKGERHPLAKLTKTDVAFIKISAMRGSDLAALFKISQSNVSMIRAGKTWAWLE